MVLSAKKITKAKQIEKNDVIQKNKIKKFSNKIIKIQNTPFCVHKNNTQIKITYPPPDAKKWRKNN